MTPHEYNRERYQRDLELHKLKRLDSFTDEKITTKEMVKITIGAVLMMPVLYYGTILMFGLLYAVSGVR